jgi:thiol-disulfide isomerase/thioredoxin
MLYLALSTGAAAQAGRSAPSIPDSGALPTAKEMFDEVVALPRVMSVRSEGDTRSDEEIRSEAVRAQKRLASKHAAGLRARVSLSDTDRYYLGLLHWLAEELDATREALAGLVRDGTPTAEQAQLARSVLVIASAKSRKFDEAEKYLSEYSGSSPKKASEQFRMLSEMTAAYRDTGDLGSAARHGGAALKASRLLFGEPGSAGSAVEQMLEAGLTLFEVRREAGDTEKAFEALEELRSAAVFAESSIVYYLATDEAVKFLFDNGQKDRALKLVEDSMSKGYLAFKTEPVRRDARRRLERREKHYRLLGEQAFELVNTSKTINGEGVTIESLRGQVVLLDFWATWCGPCIEAFPSIRAWNREFSGDLVVLGLTRYYGTFAGEEVGRDKEFEYLGGFVKEHGLDYPIIVSDGMANQLMYDAMNLPTAVLIDRAGRIRYIEVGSGKSRLEAVRAKIRQLVAEIVTTEESR